MTTPTAPPANATSGNDFDPTSSSCRISSRPSYGGVTAAFRTCQEKMPRLPNHSKKPPTNPPAKLAAEDIPTARSSGGAGVIPTTAVDPRSLNDLGRDQVRRAHCSGAYGKERSAVRYRRTQGQCSRRHRQVSCSCPSGMRPWLRSGLDTSRKPRSSCPHKERQAQGRRRHGGRHRPDERSKSISPHSAVSERDHCNRSGNTVHLL